MTNTRDEIPSGTLDMLILRTLARGAEMHGFEIAVADARETGFDYVHAKPRELPRDLQFFTEIHRGAGALLAVAQGGVEYDDAVLVGLVG